MTTPPPHDASSQAGDSLPRHDSVAENASGPEGDDASGRLRDRPGEDRPMMRLDDVLKRCGLVGTGGQAKIWIQDGQVRVNGEVETRRRKQLFLGDIVETMGQRVVLDESFFEC